MDAGHTATTSAPRYRHAQPLLTSESVGAGGPVDGPDVGQHLSFGVPGVGQTFGSATADRLAIRGGPNAQALAVANKQPPVSKGVAAASRELGDADGTVPCSLRGQKRTARRGRPRKRGDGGVRVAEVMAIVESQNRRCALSGRLLTPETAALDHKLPVARGGEHRFGNLQVLDKAVNRAKGTLINEEFIAMCGEVWRHAGALSAPNGANAPEGETHADRTSQH